MLAVFDGMSTRRVLSIDSTAASLAGHGDGTEAVEFVLATLPGVIKTAISCLPLEDISDTSLEEILQTCIRDLDLRIQEDFVSLFPGDIRDLSDDDIRRAIRDSDSPAGNSRVEVLRARTGTTALVVLIDPKESIHVASLGDCDSGMFSAMEKCTRFIPSTL